MVPELMLLINLTSMNYFMSQRQLEIIQVVVSACQLSKKSLINSMGRLNYQPMRRRIQHLLFYGPKKKTDFRLFLLLLMRFLIDFLAS